MSIFTKFEIENSLGTPIHPPESNPQQVHAEARSDQSKNPRVSAFIGVLILSALIATLLALSTRGFTSPVIASTPRQNGDIYLPLLSSNASSQPAAANFTIAVEYGIPGLAAAYAESGVTSVKLRPEFGKWGNIEFTQGDRNWATLDALVAEFQQAGFTQIQVVLMADSPWASIAPTNGPVAAEKNTFPKAEFIDDYLAFVRALVERYDGDGQADMAGLRYGIHDYAVEAEFTGFWPGSAEEYVRLLQLVYPVIHDADPQAQVALVAILAIDVFDGAPDAATVERRFAKHFAARKTVDEVKLILAACDAYDVVDFHSLGDYTEIPPTVQWLRKELTANGCAKPILIGDAFSMSILVGYVFSTFHPATRERRADIVQWLQVMADPADESYLQAEAWLRAEMARNVVRKIVVAAGEGLIGINIGNFEDWKRGVPLADKLLVPGVGTSLFMGMIDSAKTDAYAGGGPLPYTQVEFSRINESGARRPAFYALQLVQERLFAHDAITRLDFGTDPAINGVSDVWAYEIQRAGQSQWVLWVDDGTLPLPGASALQRTVELPINATQALITHTPTAIGQRVPVTQTVAVVGGVLELPVGATPIFVEAQLRTR